MLVIVLLIDPFPSADYDYDHEQEHEEEAATPSRTANPENRHRPFDFATITLNEIIMRTIVDLPDKQLKKLALFCRKEKISRAEAVRRALEQWLRGSANGGLENYFGASKTRGSVSSHLARIRREWVRFPYRR